MLSPRLIAAGVVLPLLLMTGCSGGDDPADAGASAGAGSPTADAAAADADLAAGLVTNGLEALDSGQLPEARRLFTSVLDLDPSNVYAHYNLGYLAQLDGDVGVALTQYTDALDTRSDFAPALYNLAILTEPADLEAAVDLYRRVIESVGDDAGSYFRMGHALVELGQGEEGRAMIAKSIALDPTLADAPVPTYS